MSEDIIKRVNWLELFFDLIFVYAISKATHILAHAHNGHLNIEQYFIFFLVFIPIWWTWTGHTLFVTRFEIDSAIQRALTLFQMLAVVFWTTFINADFNPNYLGYLLFYVLIRSTLIFMYLYTKKKNKLEKTIAKQLSIGFSVGLFISLNSIFFDSSIRYIILYFGIFVEIATPLFIRKVLKSSPVNSHHLPERYGLLTIILLGESVVMIATNLSMVSFNISTILATISGFLIISAIWWIYFDIMENYILNKVLFTGQNIIYGHLFIYAGLSILAVFIGFCINHKLTFLHDLILIFVSLIFLIFGFIITFKMKRVFKKKYIIFYVIYILGICVSLVACNISLRGFIHF